MHRGKTKKRLAYGGVLLIFLGTLLVYFFATHLDNLEARPVAQAILNLRNRSIAGRQLTLNGSATHTRFLFPIYNLTLYVSESSQDTDFVLDQVFQKDKFLLVEMRFLMEISSEDFRDAWSESFFANCNQHCDGAKQDFLYLISQTAGFKRNELLLIEYYPQHLSIRFNDKEYISKNKDFAKALLLTWIGENPPSRRFKKKILGET